MYEFCVINLTVSTILTESHIIYNPHRIKLNLVHYLNVSLEPA